MEITPTIKDFEENSTSEDDVWGMPKYQQNNLSALENLTDEEYLAVVNLFILLVKETKLNQLK